MWRAIAAFEIRYQLSQPLFYISAVVLFGLSLALASTGVSETFSEAPGHVHRNAPIVILRQLTVFSILGLFVVTAFVTSSVLRDFEHAIHPLFFTKPIRRADYLGGRFIGSMTVSLALFIAAAAGLAIAPFVPWQEAARLGPFQLTPYLYGLAVMVFPNLLVIGAALFALAIWTRRALWPYLFVVFYMIVQDVIEQIARSFDRAIIGSVIEPSGLVALRNVARYWTGPELNTALPELASGLLVNRLAWLALAAIVLAIGYARFRQTQTIAGAPPKRETKAASKRRAAAPAETPDPALQDDTPALAPAVRLEHVRQARAQAPTAATAWSQWIGRTRLETAQVFGGIPFLVLLAFGIVFVATFALFIGQNRGTSVHPLTYLMVQAIRMGMGTFLVVTLLFYAGELVWRERALSVAGVLDAMPVPSWVVMTAKLVALMLVSAVFVATGIAATITVQLAQGFTAIEPLLYAKGFLIIVSTYLPLAMLLLFLQTLAPNKFIGFLLGIVVLIVRMVGPSIGLEHDMLRYGAYPALPYTDLNGYGHFAIAFLWFSAYWCCAAGLLWVLTSLLWARGTDRPWRARWADAKRGWRGGQRVITGIVAAGLAVTAAVILYNTTIANEFMTRRASLDRRAQYERQYASFKNAVMPRIVAVDTEIDLYPAARRVAVRGAYRLINASAQPITQLPITTRKRTGPIDYLPFAGRLALRDVRLPAHQVVIADETIGFYVYRLDSPLAPGDSMTFGFDIEVSPRGFKSNQRDQRIVRNGTFFANKNLFPGLGYAAANEVQEPLERAKRGLPELSRAAAIGDSAAHQRNYLQADWTHYRTTISTDAEQIAIAPGRLEREWRTDGRRHFRYVTEQPVIDLAVFLSADYQVERAQWRDVAIEVYYHDRHPFNVTRLIEATQATLDYCAEHFGPYPRSVLRIVEVPNYVGLTAYSLAGVIPFSESWGFISKLRDGQLDMVTEVMAHEVAHQWWNHQVVPADVQGATMVSETMSQYTALMVVDKLFGARDMQRHLRFELDRYLAGRGREPIGERPLVHVENQPYIHYNKGSLAMYALQSRLGETTLNEALRGFLDTHAYAGPPYPHAAMLLEAIQAVTPDSLAGLVDDLLESITLFDNRIAAATGREVSGAGFVLDLHATLSKLRATEHGEETEVPLDDWLDVAVYDAQGQVVYEAPHRATASDLRITVALEARPDKVVIDPYFKLIDRAPDDNTRSVAWAESPN